MPKALTITRDDYCIKLMYDAGRGVPKRVFERKFWERFPRPGCPVARIILSQDAKIVFWAEFFVRSGVRRMGCACPKDQLELPPAHVAKIKFSEQA